MQRIYYFGSLLLLLTSCAHTRSITASTAHYHGDTDTAGGKLILLGQHPRMDLEQPPFAAWFDTDYAAYRPDSNAIARLTPLLRGRTFEIFMGTWCGDSRREVPRMFKILDACHVPADHIRLVMVDYRDRKYKQSPQHEEQGKDIIHVPDLLVLDNAQEMGRIVESPVVSLEKDLVSIAAGEPYRPQYGAAYWLSGVLKSYPEYRLEADFERITDTLRTKTSHDTELYPLSYILLLHGDTAHALLVGRLNAAAFPTSAWAYTTMGKLYDWIQDIPGARLAYQKAVALDPKAKQAKEWLDAHP
jgi:thiol-disulfide isomerase/thioredoxin